MSINKVKWSSKRKTTTDHCQQLNETQNKQKSNSSWQWTVSKERPSSIVTEILKNRILIPIDASKELDLYANFKYISFIKFSLTHQKLRA